MIRALRGYVARYTDSAPSPVRWFAVAAWAALLWILSAMPGGSGPGPTWWSWFWNSGHVVAYFVLSILACAAISTSRPCKRKHAIAAVVGAVVYGVVDELHQSTVPGRDCSLLDVVNDAVGAVLGVVLGFAHERKRLASAASE